MSRFLYRLWRYARHHPVEGCPHCGQLLRVCPTCGGAWREAACGACGLGMLCPRHHNHWPA